MDASSSYTHAHPATHPDVSSAEQCDRRERSSSPESVTMCTKRSAALVFAMLLIACGGERRGDKTASVGLRGAHGDTLTIAIIGKSSSNPVFPAAEKGAEAAARDLARKHNMHIAVHSLTPSQENAETQAERVREAVNYGADAILVSASDAAKL